MEVESNVPERVFAILVELDGDTRGGNEQVDAGEMETEIGLAGEAEGKTEDNAGGAVVAGEED